MLLFYYSTARSPHFFAIQHYWIYMPVDPSHCPISQVLTYYTGTGTFELSYWQQNQVQWRRDKVQEFCSKGYSQREIYKVSLPCYMSKLFRGYFRNWTAITFQNNNNIIHLASLGHVRSVLFLEYFMNKGDSDWSFAHRGRDTLYAAATHVTHRENTR